MERGGDRPLPGRAVSPQRTLRGLGKEKARGPGNVGRC